MKTKITSTVPRITPFLWFKHEAEQAARFYTSVFGRSRILSIARYPKGAPGKPGSVMMVDFRIEGQEFTALNGGSIPGFKLNPAISFVVHCRTQREIDYYWRRLSAGGKKVQCGWLEDKFGVSWQVAPEWLLKIWTTRDQARAERVMKAMGRMVKLDLKKLEQAARGD